MWSYHSIRPAMIFFVLGSTLHALPTVTLADEAYLPGERRVKLDLTGIPMQYIAHYGFHKGGQYKITGTYHLSFNSPNNFLGNRTIAYLMACSLDGAQDIVGPYSLYRTRRPLTNSGSDASSRPTDGFEFCDSSKYLAASLCKYFPFRAVQVDAKTYVAQLAASHSLLSEEVIIFYVTQCELWGNARGVLQNSCPDRGTTTDKSKNSTSSCSLPVLVEGTESFASFQLELENPDGYLSSVEEPFIPLYLVSTIFWIVTVSLWWIHITFYSRRQHVVSLQWKIHGMSFFRLFCAVGAYLLWVIKARAYLAGTTFVLYYVFLIGLRIVYRCYFAQVFLLLAKGWQITRAQLHPIEMRNLKFLLICYAAAWILYYCSLAVEDGKDTRILLAGIIVLTIMYIMVFYSIWYSVSQQLTALCYQINLIRAYNINPRTTPVWIKYHMYRRFRTGFGTYLVISFIADVLTSSRMEQTPWLPIALDEIIEALIIWIVTCNFRARNFNPYFARIRQMLVREAAEMQARLLEEAPRNNDNRHAQTEDRLTSGLQRRDSSLTEWNPSMGLPRAPDHFFHPKRSKVVVFVNPDDQLRIGAAAQLSESDRPTAGSFVVKPAAQLPIECGTQKNSLEEEDRNKNTTAHQRPNPIASMQGQGFGRKSTSEEQEENRDDEDLHSG